MRFTPKKLSLFALSLGLSGVFTHAQQGGAPSCEFDAKLNQWLCTSEGETQSLDNNLDWVPLKYLSETERARLAPGCEGQYKDPYAGLKFSDQTLREMPLEIDADYAEGSVEDKALLQGQVRFSQGPRSVSAETMSFDRKINQAELDGGVSIRQPGMLIRGDNAKVSTVEQNSSFSGASFVMHDTHLRGSADKISQRGEGRVVLENGMLTSCEPNARAWSLEGQELSIDQSSGQGYGKNVRLKIGSVPVFYLPYISFPVGDQRRSGFLFPSISSSDDGGIDIAVPYYFNLAENYDATLTPRYISGRGSMFEAELRHLSVLFRNDLNLTYLPNDSGGSDRDVERLIAEQALTEQEAKPHKGDNRWLVHFTQRGGKREGWYSDINYAKVSDIDYFRDLGSSSFSANNTSYLNQIARAGYLGKNWNFDLRLQDYQLLLVDLRSPYRRVPQLSAEGHYPIDYGHFSLHTQYTRFNLRNEAGADTRLTGQRLFGDYRLQWDFSNQAAYLKPEVGYKSLAYLIDDDEFDELNDEAPRLGAAQASLDMGLVFENPGGRYLQTFEPRAYYLFREYEDHSSLYEASIDGRTINFDSSARTFSYGQLYRDSRFAGSDRLDDANQITLGATTRWYSKQSGRQIFQLSFGQINHFRDRRIGLNQEISATENSSEWAADVNWSLSPRTNVYGGFIYDDVSEKMNRIAAGMSYRSSDDLSLFNMSYSFVRQNPEVLQSEPVEQLDLSGVGPISKQWFAMARVNYDLENGQELETFAGLEYNDCCYRFRILARRWLDSNIAKLVSDEDAIFDQGLFFEIHFKGLGGSGAKVNSILEDAIPGYRERENTLNLKK